MAVLDAERVAAHPAEHTAAPRVRRRTLSTRGWHRVFVAPAVLAILVLGLYPLVFTVAAALSVSQLGAPFQRWVGLANLAEVLGDGDQVAALVRVVVFALVVAAVSTLIGTAVALALHRVAAGGLIRTLLLLPLILAPVVVAVLFKLILTPSGGLLDTVLRLLGHHGAPVSLLADPAWAIVAVAAADVWEWTPLVTLLVLAALLGQDRGVLEAAELDGARGWALLRSIVLPSVAGSIAAAFLIRLVLAFKVFDLVAVMTAGGPGTSTSMPSYFTYQAALQQFDLGRASAITLLLAVVVTVVTLPVAALTRRLHHAAE
ncbi:carbohydrate ABC transporter permease [Microbacterium sp. SORGH_AS_0888]|uniref:carbohydrate ABC transporter permease n=1 Tax=Microbacterium sp. SORGH_AS_0888 TaxID=3041791 RepID=UPI002782A9FE|nr:sugar ABC transporter permease [Microbacterium sp. SORGH_AS_0888]MDQ1130897.1 multiple sugar transport system permease protein [Microbacterium sp. SORGH_AS_0888]